MIVNLVWELIIHRVSKELYAPALGGIMLSIGIKLSVDDFALAINRYLLIVAWLLSFFVLCE